MKNEKIIREKQLQPRTETAESETFFLIDLKNDYAFKRVFGTPGHEDDLLLLLRALLPDKHIKSVLFKLPYTQSRGERSTDQRRQATAFHIQAATYLHHRNSEF